MSKKYVWKPTALAINRLPEEIKSYLFDLQKASDPENIISENMALRGILEEQKNLISNLQSQLSIFKGASHHGG